MIPKHIMESKLITDEQWEEYLELKENSTWWSNRFNAVERDKRELKERIDKAIENLQIGIDTYNNGGSRTSLFECISDSIDILEGNDE